ncbi:hypothetical protein JMUB7532_27510 [Staphylococcus aureus]
MSRGLGDVYKRQKFDVKRGKIEHAKIFGDFFGVGDVTDLENALVGCLHDFEHIEDCLLYTSDAADD